jgi:hypothetical protein
LALANNYYSSFESFTDFGIAYISDFNYEALLLEVNNLVGSFCECLSDDEELRFA